MSEIKETGYKQMECGDTHHPKKMQLSDTGAGFVNLQVVGTDPHVSGVKTGASITVGTGDYSPPSGHKNPDQTFLICIETEGVFYVTLFDGSDFIITAVQAAAYLGQWYPARIYSVNIGTTGNFSIGY
jgi:hypothetical protein